MKRTFTCPKCNGKKIGHFSELQDLSEATRRLSKPQPRQIAIASEVTSGFLGAGTKESLAGETEAYVCAACGYFEEYVKAPEAVPWDQLLHFKWCNA